MRFLKKNNTYFIFLKKCSTILAKYMLDFTWVYGTFLWMIKSRSVPVLINTSKFGRTFFFSLKIYFLGLNNQLGKNLPWNPSSLYWVNMESFHFVMIGTHWSIQKRIKSHTFWAHCHAPVIPAAREAVAGGLKVWGHPQQLKETLSQSKKIKRAGSITHW